MLISQPDSQLDGTSIEGHAFYTRLQFSTRTHKLYSQDILKAKFQKY